MTTVELRGLHLLVDGHPMYLRSGTVHYWRLPPQAWPDRLLKARQAHLNAVETYIPWFWHEPEEGRFDLDGRTHPGRDLEAFLSLVEETGLYLVARPGPFINSELRLGGHPAWLFERHPEVISRRADGSPAFWIGHGQPVPSQLHPIFLQLVGRWYEQVIPLLARHQAASGGCVLLAQPDNEMNLVFTYGLDGSLYDPHVLGDGTTPGLWQQWLAGRHGGVEDLARRHGRPYERLEEVAPPSASWPAGDGEWRLALDWLRFKRWHIVAYGRELARRMRQGGLSVPVVFNEPVNQSWVWGSGEHGAFGAELLAEGERAASGPGLQTDGETGAFTAGHTYLYGGEMDLFGLAATLSRLEMIRTSGLEGPLFSIEAGASWYEYGDKTRADYNWDLLFRVLLGHGLDAYNVYIFAGGRNPPGSTITGDDYSWQAPLLPDGAPSPAYPSLQRLGRFIEAWEPHILATDKREDVAVAVFADLPLLARPFRFYLVEESQAGERFPLPQPGSTERKRRELFRDTFGGLAETVKLLTALNVSFRYLHLDHPQATLRPSLPLIVPAPGLLPLSGLRLVEAHLGAGGRVLLWPCPPQTDADLYPQPGLQGRLGLRVRRRFGPPGWAAGDSRYRTVETRQGEVAVRGGLYTFEQVDGRPVPEAEVVARHQGQPCVVRRQVLDGEALLAGLFPAYLTPDSVAFFQELLLDELGVRRGAWDTAGVLHVAQRAGQGREAPTLVLAANCRGRESPTRLVLRTPAGELTFPTHSQLEVLPKSARMLWTNLELSYGRLAYCTSELVPVPGHPDRGRLEAYGDPGTRGELAIDRPFRLAVGGRSVTARPHGPWWVATYPHRRGALPLRVQPAEP